MVSTSFMFLSRRTTNIISSKARLPPSNQLRSFSTKLGDVNIGENEAARLFPEEVNIIYDSKCNKCKLEIDFLAKRDAEKINVGAPKLKMTELESETYICIEVLQLNFLQCVKSMFIITQVLHLQ